MIKDAQAARSPRFKAGQSVYMAASRSQWAVGGRYKIVRSLPIANGRFQYRVKGDNEAFERVVDEGQLAVES
jgi:hypothetical protein